MKTILRIAKLELATLFYSPIAWFLGIIFFFQSAYAYTHLTGIYLKFQEMGGYYLSYNTFLTLKIIGGNFGLFTTVISKIYLYLPLLTMGLISREVSSGTIKLLYSSPIKVKQIVLGKFFAIMAYNLVLLAMLGGIMIIAAFNIKHIDTGIIFTCLLGVFLLLCTYSAIGLFMSSLTSYQIVAAISTLVIFAALANVGQLWQGIDFVRDLTYFLSIADRTINLLDGLIVSKDLVYYIVITLLFILFTIVKLQSDRETKPVAVLAGKYLGLFVLALAIGYVASLPRFTRYVDVTAKQICTLTPNTQKVIAKIGDEPMEITLYANLLDNNFRFGAPESRNESQRDWEKYLRFKPNIKLNYVYFYATPLDGSANFAQYYPGKTVKQIAQQRAETYNISFDKFKTQEEIDKIINLRPELYRSVMQVKFKGRTTFLRYFNDQAVIPDEPEITAAFKRLTVPLPKIAFLQGEYERSIEKLGPHDYGAISSNITFRYALINQGFDVEIVTLQNQEIPKGITALVIGDPRAAFSPVVLAKIQKYIADGGNLLITGEGDKRDILQPLLQPLGVQMLPGQLLQKSRNNPLDMVVPLLTKTAGDFSGKLKAAFKDSLGVTMPGVVGLTYAANSPFTIKPLLMTDERSTWNKKGKAVLDSAAIEYSAVNGDDNRSVSPLLALTRDVNGKEQRIIIAGDADFMTTPAMGTGKANFAFNTEIFRWFTYGQFPIDASRPDSDDTGFDLTGKSMNVLRICLLWVLPGLLVTFAIVFLIRRKRK